MSSPQDPWHFPRTSLAETHFALIDKGLANALVLFGRRRTGKTEFLLKDLTPVAENAKRTVVYVNFWSSPLAPTAVLIRALETALKGGPLAHGSELRLTRFHP
jgi:predicted AAA+ superfamily ATPase